MDEKNKFSPSSISSSAPNIDIKGYFFKVLAYWKLFLVTITIALIVAKFMNGYKAKRYSLDTTISVKEENNPLFSGVLRDLQYSSTDANGGTRV